MAPGNRGGVSAPAYMCAAVLLSCLTTQPTPRTSLRLPSHPFRTIQVAADLASLHDAGVLHRHVTIASVALARTGNLATARLMGHPYNVEAGQT